METLFTGKNKVQHNQAASTNTLAMEMLKAGNVPEGTLVSARFQEKGRGQRENAWHSETGKNMLLSFVFYPRFLDLQKQFMLTMACSLSVKKCVEHLLGDRFYVQVKWPNDIIAGDKKIAGILIENTLKGERIQSSVCGFGINVNQDFFPAFVPPATSLKLLSGKEFDTDACTVLFCSFLEKEYLRLREGDERGIKNEYKQSLYRMGEWHPFKQGENVFPACIRGVEDNGMLQLEIENGSLMVVDFRQITFVF